MEGESALVHSQFSEENVVNEDGTQVPRYTRPGEEHLTIHVFLLRVALCKDAPLLPQPTGCETPSTMQDLL